MAAIGARAGDREAGGFRPSQGAHPRHKHSLGSGRSRVSDSPRRREPGAGAGLGRLIEHRDRTLPCGAGAFFNNELEQASTLVEEAATLQRTLGDTVGLAHSLLLLGWTAAARRDHERAMALREEALALGQRAEDDYTTILARALGAFAALELGDYRRAALSVRKALT